MTLALALMLVLAQDAGVDDTGGDELPRVPSRLKEPPLATAAPIAPEKDVLALAELGSDARYHLDGGTLTIDPKLQKSLVDTLKLYQTPYAAAVVLDARSGEVLAMAEHSESDPAMRGLCVKAAFPAASIFKIVTAAALLDAGVAADESVCFHGGKRRVSEKQLADTERDDRCQTFADALALSGNVAFAKLTQKHLEASKLDGAARALGFNARFEFPEPVEPSLAAIPLDKYPLALTGAGFGDVFLSPLHGALIAAAVGNKGLWREPLLFKGAASPERRVLSEDVASKLSQMLALTVENGTARRMFHERGNRLNDAAGKTGSLADKKPFRDYSWFVGYAPRENPKVAVATVIVNDAYWRIRATWLGREALRRGLDAVGKHGDRNPQLGGGSGSDAAAGVRTAGRGGAVGAGDESDAGR